MKHLHSRLSDPSRYLFFSHCAVDCASESEGYKLSVVKEQKISDIDREIEAIDKELNKKNIFSNPSKRYERIKRKEAKRKAKGKLPTLSAGQDDFVRRREELELRKADLLKDRCSIEEATSIEEIRALEEKGAAMAHFGKQTEMLGVECGTIRSTDILLKEIEMNDAPSCETVVRSEKKCAKVERKEIPTDNSHDRFLLSKYIRLEKDLVCAADSREQHDVYGGAIAVPEKNYRKLSAKEKMLIPSALYRAKMNSLLLAVKKAALKDGDIVYKGNAQSLEAVSHFEFSPSSMYIKRDDGERGSRVDRVIVDIDRNADGTSRVVVRKEFGGDLTSFDTDIRSHKETLRDTLYTEDCKKIDGGAYYELNSAIADGVSDKEEKKVSFEKNMKALDEIIQYFQTYVAVEGSPVCACEAF